MADHLCQPNAAKAIGIYLPTPDEFSEVPLSHIEMMNRFAKSVFFGNNGTGHLAGVYCRDQTRTGENYLVQKVYPECHCPVELSISLRIINKSGINGRMEEMIGVIRNGTAVTWQHINMLGKYDFDKLLTNKELRFNLQKNI